jgi:hypothetical protein
MRLFFLFDFPKRIRKLMGSGEAEGANFGGIDAMRKSGLLVLALSALLSGLLHQSEEAALLHLTEAETDVSASPQTKRAHVFLKQGAHMFRQRPELLSKEF